LDLAGGGLNQHCLNDMTQSKKLRRPLSGRARCPAAEYPAPEAAIAETERITMTSFVLELTRAQAHA
jgi:hypothetical protein